MPQRRPNHPSRREGAPDVSLLACLRAGPRGQGRSMGTGRTGRSHRNEGFASMPRRCCSIRTGSRSRFRKRSTARPRAGRADNAAVAMKSVVADPARYDWEGDRPLNRPFAETIIYELHVRGFTRHPSSGVAVRDERDLRRIDREDSVSRRSRASPPSSCCPYFSSIRRMRRRAG